MSELKSDPLRPVHGAARSRKHLNGASSRGCGWRWAWGWLRRRQHARRAVHRAPRMVAAISEIFSGAGRRVHAGGVDSEMLPESIRLRRDSALFPCWSDISSCISSSILSRRIFILAKRRMRRRCTCAMPAFRRCWACHSHVFRRRGHRFGVSGFRLAGHGDFSGHRSAQNARGVHGGFADAGWRRQPQARALLAPCCLGVATVSGVLLMGRCARRSGLHAADFGRRDALCGGDGPDPGSES